MLVKHFKQQGDKWQISPQLRQMVSFREYNLLGDLSGLGQFDIVFCRNVLIYFDRVGRTQVINNFARMLEPGGYLFLGHSESLYGVSDRFRQTGPTIYRRL